MSEIRKHYFLDEYCIIASERGKRPSDFKAADVGKGEAKGVISEVSDIVPGCFFCDGNESSTPPATAVYKQGKVFIDTETERESGWDMRCFPNLFPAVAPNNITSDTAPSDNLASGYGFHEIIVESPKHGMSLSGFDDDQMKLLMRVYRDRVAFYQAQEAIEFVSLFKNQGKIAGASLSHTHTQLIALPMVPPALKRELAVIKNAAEGASTCPYCDIVSAESESKGKNERLLAKNSHFIAIAPYYSTAPFEIWILPVEHASHMSRFDDSMLDSLALILKEMLARLDTALSNPSHNYMFYQMVDDDYHFNLRIQPALAIIAGFEKNTGIYINSVVPEQVGTFI